MDGLHIISTAPYFARKKGEYTVEDFDLYCTVLSALYWRRYNGSVTLYTDSAGAAYYQKSGLSAIWDGIRVCIPDDLEGIDPEMFWAGGKLFALREVKAPCAMFDTDFIVWKRLNLGNELVAAHFEDIKPDIYPPPEYFRLKNHYFPDFNYNVLPINTAFLYIPNDDFREFYVSQSIAFMKSAERCGERLKYMVFAEQRMASMCAEYTGTPIRTLLDKDHLFFPQDAFTHLWGAKQAMRDHHAARADFCRKCAGRIKREFPEYSYMVDIIQKISCSD